MKYDRMFTHTINDDVWTFVLVTEEEALEMDDGLGYAAMTDTKEKYMYITESNVSRGVVTHELFHLYVSYFNLNSADITVDQFEEIVAEFLENNLDKFCKTVNKLLKKFVQLEEMGRKK